MGIEGIYFLYFLFCFSTLLYESSSDCNNMLNWRCQILFVSLKRETRKRNYKHRIHLH